MIAPFGLELLLKVANHRSLDRTQTLLPNDPITYVDLRPCKRLDEYKRVDVTVAYSPGID
jgi:hypothetical protein